jgi:hypothetical protein
LDFIQDEVAAIAQHQVALLEGQVRGGGQVVFAVRVDGCGDPVVVAQVVNGLDSGVADGGMGAGHAGKIRKEMAGQLEDGAVLDQHPVIVAKQRGWLGGGSVLPGELLPDHLFQQPLQEVFKRLVQAAADGLPGGSGAGKGLPLGGQVVATGRSLKAVRADGGEQTEAINFPGGSQGEFAVFGQLAEVGFGEQDRAEGKRLGGGWPYAPWPVFVLTFSFIIVFMLL